MAIILSVIFIASQLIFAAFILFLCLAFVTGGPFVPSSKTAVAAMVGAAHIKKGMTVYDVGSGDGRVLFAAAAQGANAVGIEINPYLVLYTRIRAFFSPYRGRIRVIWGNLWRTPVSGANLVFVYLIPWKMDALADKLNSELSPGTTVVSNSFIFPHWKSIHTDSKHHIYSFRVS